MAVEKALGRTTDPDATCYRARAVLLAGGDVKREAERLDALISQGLKTDHLTDHLCTARAACAVALGQSPVEFLDKVKGAERNTPIARGPGRRSIR